MKMKLFATLFLAALLPAGCEPAGPQGYVGTAACQRSTPIYYKHLELPQQTEAELPMAVDSSGRDYMGFIIFRAPAAWQEQFRREHTLKGLGWGQEEAMGYAQGLAESVEDGRILRFIREHEWQPFHEGRLYPGQDWYFTALRDSRGEYMLILLNTI